MDIKKMWIPYSSKTRPSRAKSKKTSITVHNTGNPKSTAQGERNWLVNPKNNRYASWHYCIDEKDIVQAIPEEEEAYHCGNREGNLHSIGIEICESGNYEKTEERAIAFIAKLLDEKGWEIDRVKKHQDWSGKYCPRLIIPYWAKFLQRIKQQRKGAVMDWKDQGIKYLAEKGMMNDPEGWIKKKEDPMPVWAVTTILAELHKNLSGESTEKPVEKPEEKINSSYRVEGITHIIETDPRNIDIELIGDTLSSKGKTGINGTYFDTKDPANPKKVWGIAVSNGKPIGEGYYAHWQGYARGTVFFTRSGILDCKRIVNIQDLPKDVLWAISGYLIFDKGMAIGKADFIREGFGGGYSDVWNHSTNRTLIGIKDGKVLLIARANSTWERIQKTCQNLGIEKAVMMDGGGSSQMYYQGSEMSGRKVSTAIILKEV